MNHLLLAYDGSEPSRRAAAQAAELARCLGAQVTVLVVGELVPSGYDAVVPVSPAEEFERLAEEGAALVREAGAPAEPRVEWGDPVELIPRTADELGAEPIVLGHRGRGGLSSLLLGSVAKQVMDHARRSVLVVR
ncbi:MAG: universal stress protein [Armatimonadota bacterium]